MHTCVRTKSNKNFSHSHCVRSVSERERCKISVTKRKSQNIPNFNSNFQLFVCYVKSKESGWRIFCHIFSHASHGCELSTRLTVRYEYKRYAYIMILCFQFQVIEQQQQRLLSALNVTNARRN